MPSSNNGCLISMCLPCVYWIITHVPPFNSKNNPMCRRLQLRISLRRLPRYSVIAPFMSVTHWKLVQGSSTTSNWLSSQPYRSPSSSLTASETLQFKTAVITHLQNEGLGLFMTATFIVHELHSSANKNGRRELWTLAWTILDSMTSYCSRVQRPIWRISSFRGNLLNLELNTHQKN